MATTQQETYVTIAEAAEIAGVTKVAVWKWLKSGKLRGRTMKKIGRKKPLMQMLRSSVEKLAENVK